MNILFTQQKLLFMPRFVSLLMVVCALVSLIPAGIARADANQLIVTPNPHSMRVGEEQSFSIKAYIDSSVSPQSAVGTVTFPPGQLQAKNPASSSGWSGNPAINQGQGTISFNMSRNSSTTGFSTVFTVTFRATSGGTAVIGFGGDSRVNNETTSYKSAVISITNPAPAQSSAPKPSTAPKPSVAPVPIVSSTPSPTPTTTPDPQPTPDPTGVVDSVLIKSFYNSATIAWSVNVTNPTSTLQYGSKASTLDKQATVTKTADGSYTTTIPGLEPGNRYYFSINGSGGGKSGTYSGTIVANGYPVTVTVTENNIAVKGAQVKVGSRTYSTSSNGKASFGLATGNYKITITTETASQTFDLAVAKKAILESGSPPESQTFAFNLSSSALAQGPGSGATIMAFVGALLVGTILITLGFFGVTAYKRRRFESGDTSSVSQPSPTVIIDDGYDWHKDTTPQRPPLSPIDAPTLSPPRHNNSVYLDEEEPLDMFEQNKLPK